MSEVIDRSIEGTLTKKPVVIPDELEIHSSGQDVDYSICGMFRILTAKDGDKRVVWRRESIPEINAAKETFNKLIQEGLVPYKVAANGKATDQVMDEFDAGAEEIIFMPMRAVVGG